MAINKEVVEEIKKDIRRHANRYDQETFGFVGECGTTMCIAGFCRVYEVGFKQFKKEIDGDGEEESDVLCRDSGRRLLGIKGLHTPQIFMCSDDWPEDLSTRYYSAKTNKERAEVACEGLDRLKVDGSIRKLKRK